MDDLLADFLTETNEGLVALDAALLRLERNPEEASALSEAFRIVHTIKGTCGFLGLSRLEAVAHAAENVLGKYRDKSLDVTPSGVTSILRAVDCIRNIVAGLEKRGAEPAGDDAILIGELDATSRGEHAAKAAEVIAEPAPAATTAAPEASAASEGTAAADALAGAAPQTIRVAVDVLEDLMMLVSELVLTRNQLLQLARADGNQAFAVPLQRLSHITSDLQEGVMKTRMQPIGNAWAKLPRLVRDLSQELGKKISLEMRGSETELDRQVLELIKDPLTHMVRNSADHGLEAPDQRRAAGKPETGRILLNAYHEGGHIIIEIGDDGRGLPIEKIRAKAVALGMATDAEVAGMSEREILRFIFRPGFSTASQVTAVSGRGVGMDVVKTNMERIGGTIEVASREGRGTTFTIKIPLTLAIVSALIVEAGGERFAIPQIGVLELVGVGGGNGPALEHIKDAPVLRLRDRLLPLVSLARLLELRTDVQDHQGFVVVTQVGTHVFGIIVDKVFDTEEIVVKPVAPILRHITMFSGNTILGDGSVIMILDQNGIARATGLGLENSDGSGQAARQNSLGPSSERTALLLFKAGNVTPKAVPLGLVARLEDIERDKIEFVGDRPVVQYRGKLMPLVPLSPQWSHEIAPPRQPILVFSDDDRAMGLVVDEILDVVEVQLDVDATGERPGYLGSIVVEGRVTEVIDCAWWLHQTGDDWFSTVVRPSGHGGSVLVVEDSAFFRNLVGPALRAAGYRVATVATAAEAMRMRDAGADVDVIVSDIVMPEMDGVAFVRAIRESGPWRDKPVIALTGRVQPEDVELGREAGFTDYVAKFDRAALLASLHQCLATSVEA